MGAIVLEGKIQRIQGIVSVSLSDGHGSLRVINWRIMDVLETVSSVS
jgi:hypothetical protein